MKKFWITVFGIIFIILLFLALFLNSWYLNDIKKEFNVIDKFFVLSLYIILAIFLSFIFLPIKLKIIRDKDSIVIKKIESFFIKHEDIIKNNSNPYIYAKKRYIISSEGGDYECSIIFNKNEEIKLKPFSYYLEIWQIKLFNKDEIIELGNFLGLKVVYQKL